VSTLRVQFGWRTPVELHLAVQRTAHEVAQ
jgi:hypothetical protein